MKAYSIFDDFTHEAIELLQLAGIELTVHPVGVPRPNHDQMKIILEEYDCVIIGTSQKISRDMLDNINSHRIIATASVGVDHIELPEAKKNLVTIINTPKANAQSVAEYTMACALSCVKRLAEAQKLYCEGKNNKALYQKPEDLAGKTIGVIGAGNISVKIMEYAQFFGMSVLCWTRNPGRHSNLTERGVRFASLEEIAAISDVISVNLPNNNGTKGIISPLLVKELKNTAIFISVSRLETIDIKSLFQKAKQNPTFYLCLDLDVNDDVVKHMQGCPNMLITPHIAGGTAETRKRMFREVAEKIVELA